MKNKIILTTAIFLLITTTNVSAENEGQGQWYRFTNDYIINCIQSIRSAKEASTETSGKTVSAVNAPRDISSCLSTSPYLDSETQIEPLTAPKGCKSAIQDNFLLPVGSNLQSVELLSKDLSLKATFKCVASNWLIQSSKTINYEKNECPENGVSWFSDQSASISYSLGNASTKRLVERNNNCFANLPKTKSGNTVTAKSITDLGEGKIKFKCENGNWLKLSNSIYKSTCNINLCKSNQTVTWFSNEGNHICSDKILVTDGKIALVKYHKNDKRLFHSKSDALENSKIFEGRANFKCKNSKWIIDDNYENTCNKKQDFSCTVKHTIKVGSKYIKQYQCGVK